MKSTEQKLTGHFIGGVQQYPVEETSITVRSPVDGSDIGFVPEGGQKTVSLAVSCAENAFSKWSVVPVKERIQVLLKFKTLLELNIDLLCNSIHNENGKTISEAKAELEKGIEVIEFAASLPQILAQEKLEVSTGVECESVRVPLGVTLSITPFNFPAMVPLWTIPISIGCGNTFILKPSEQTPLTPVILAEIFKEAGLPDGVFIVVHGKQSTAELLIEQPQVKAISFVGSTAIAKRVYTRGTEAGKRVIALGGAKNHLVVVPDADPEITAKNIVASAMGCAGQRCMAASVLILVGDTGGILDRVTELASSIRTGTEMGAIISAKAKQRIETYINRAEEKGYRVFPDGRNVSVEGREGGNYLGPTIIHDVNPGDECACDEIFGPVLSVLRVDTLDEAIAIENASRYGNAASVYTSSGSVAKYFSERVSSGMVGINIGVPVPREPFSFGGWNESKFGAGDITGMDGVRFWTRLKKITTKWTAEASRNWMS